MDPERLDVFGSVGKLKPEHVSFTNLQINDSFTHYRSVSYFEAISNVASSISGKSKLGSLCALDQQLKQHHQNRLTSCSTPCTPKKIEINKYSTLPPSGVCGVNSTSAKKSKSLSNFFSKLKPKFYRSAIDMKNPWIVIEFSPNNQDCESCDGSDKSDHSIELAIKTKEEHFTSLKDFQESIASDSCKCILNSTSVNRKKDYSGSDFLSPDSANKFSDSFNGKMTSNSCSKYRSEGSILFRLSPRRRFERIKHVLKNLTKKNRCRNCSNTSRLGAKHTKSKSETHLKMDQNIMHREIPSFFSQVYQSNA